ncbi:MAG: peptidylprolyl isomerase [Ignavibacteria bacterium]|nr:peptidylprolyl isomerase [Ignavibacteria bacterium]
MKHIFILFLSITLFPNIVLSQNYSPEEKEILLLQDSRTLGENDILLSYLKSENANVVSRAVFALANIQDSSTADEISTVLLTNQNEYIRFLAAYALGQIPCEPSQIYLRTALKSETSMYVREQLLEAIGKIGTEEDLNLVPSDVSNIDYDKFYSALSVLRFGLRKIKNERSFQILADILNSNPDAKTTMLCLYTLWRTGDDKLLKPHTDLLKKYLKDTEGLNRSYAINALGKLKDTQILFEILSNVKNETDWRAKVNSFNIINNFTYEQIKDKQDDINEVLMSLLRNRGEDDNNKVSYVIAYLGAVNKLYSNQNYTKTTNPKFYDILNSFTSEKNISGEAIKVMGSIFKDEMKDELINRYKQSTDYNIKADIIRAFSSFNNGKIFREVRDLISNDVMEYGKTHTIDKEKYIGAEDLAKIYRAYSELINACLSKVNDEDKNTIRLICYDFLTSKDVVMVANCLETLKDSSLQRDNWKAETSQVIQFEYPNLSLPQDFDLMSAYIDFIGEMKIEGLKTNLEANLTSDQYEITKRSADALKKITGNDYSNRIKNKIYNKDFDWEYLKKIFVNKYASVKTNKGTIKIELFPEVTPFTVYNFVKLSERGYYNGTIFHRVVPNFVIQGGDPTATGNGGPGYSIRSEFSQLNFFTGAVGMASSGKDTEGSQWFITHSPQLHLDSRYTLFGIVVDGQDVVDKTQIGDKIESITFSASK